MRRRFFLPHITVSFRPICMLILLALFARPQSASAQLNGQVVITVQNELGAALTGASFSFQTSSMGAAHVVADGGANDSDGTNNGTIVISAADMAAFGAAACDTWTSATVTKAGYVNTDVTVTAPGFGGPCGGGPGASNRYHANRNNSAAGSLSFTVRVNSPNDQFGNPIALAGTNTAFAGLTLTDPVSYNGGNAFLPASPAAPAVLSMTRAGFLTAATTAAVAPSAAVQTIVRYGTGLGQQGPAIQYNINVTAQDELGNALALNNATTNSSGLTFTATVRFNAGTAYLPADPAAPGKLTISVDGYVNTTTAANVVPNATQVQTIQFRPANGQGAGLPFAVFARGWDELNFRRVDMTAVNTGFNAGLPLNGAIRYNDSSAYLPLTAARSLTLSQKGYVDVTTKALVTPVATKQDTVDFRPGAANAAAGLPFSFRLLVKDAAGAALDGAHVDLLTGSETHVKDVNGDSIWTSPSPSGAADGYVYIPIDETADDNATLSLRVQHASYLTAQTENILNELNSGFQIQRILQMGAQLAAPTLRGPSSGEIVGTLKPTLKWTGGAGATSFQLQVSAQKDMGAAVLDTTIGADSLVLPRNLVDKTVYYWRVRSIGQGGNTGPYSDVWSFKVILDNIPPVAVLPAPGKDSILTGMVGIRFTATDNDTVVSREISIDGAAFVAATNDSAYLWNTALYPDGVHSLQVRARDRGGNVGYSAIVQFRLDNSPPALAVIALRYDAAATLARKGSQVLVRVSARDPAGMAKDSAVVLMAPALDSAHRVVLLLDDGKNGDISAGDGIYTVLLPLTTDSVSVPFSVRARDALGHDTTVTGVFRLDLTAPSVAYAFDPAPGNGPDALHGEVYADKVVIKGTAADLGGAGLASLHIEVRNDSGAQVQNSPVQMPALAGAFSHILSLVPGGNHIAVIASDSAGNQTTVTSLLTYIDPKMSGLIGRSGGSVFAADSSGVVIGDNALQGSLQVTLRQVPPSEEPKPRDAQLRLVGVARDFGPNGTVFRSPVTVRLTYTEADLDPNQDGVRDFDPARLIIVFWDGQTWIKAGEPVIDTVRHFVSVQVNHFTLFDLAQGAPADTSNVIAYWTHNPLKPIPGSTFAYSLPAAGKVSLHILDLAGDMVREIIPKGTARGQGQWSEQWNGNNVNDRFAGVGLYVYIFKYESDDHKYHKLIRLPIGLGK